MRKERPHTIKLLINIDLKQYDDEYMVAVHYLLHISSFGE